MRTDTINTNIFGNTITTGHHDAKPLKIFHSPLSSRLSHVQITRNNPTTASRHIQLLFHVTHLEKSPFGASKQTFQLLKLSKFSISSGTCKIRDAPPVLGSGFDFKWPCGLTSKSIQIQSRIDCLQYFQMKVDKRLYLLLVTLLSAVLFASRGDEESHIHSRLLITLDPTRVITTTPRLSIINICPSGATRSTLVSSAQKASNNQYFGIMKTYFNVDITSILKSLLNNDIATVTTQVRSLGTPFIIYIVPFVLGLLISLFLWAFLCCCCVCPSCCPSKCCQHDADKIYTKCELLWPAIFCLIVLLAAIGASIPGITQASKLSDSIRTMQCGIGITLDDLLNGNITNDQTSFFSGTNTLITQLSGMTSTLNNIDSNLTNVKTRVTDVKNTAQGIYQNIQTLANPTTNASLILSYSNPTPGAAYTTNSLFIPILGNPTNASSIEGGLWTGVYNLYSTMLSIETAVTNFKNAVSGGTVVAGINAATAQFTPINNNIRDIAGSVSTMFTAVSPILGYVKLGVIIFFGVTIGLSVLALLGLVLTAFFDKAKCRHLMYFACVFMTIILLVGFLLSTLFAIFSPVLYMACSVLNPALANKTGFTDFQNNVGLSGNQAVMVISDCLPLGSGNVLASLGITALNDLNQNMQDLSSSMSGINTYANFDPTVLTVPANDALTEMNYWMLGQRNDLFDNTNALTYFKALANGSQYSTICSGNANYAADSIVPSTDSKSTGFVPCSKTNMVICSGGQTIGSKSGQNGCIDMTSCFESATTANVLSEWNARYLGCGIGADMQQIFDNWDQKRRGSNSIGIQKVSYDYSTNINSVIQGQLVTDLNNLKTTSATAVTNINAAALVYVDPDYGVTAGLNCRVLGEDIVVAKDTVCVSFFNSIFFLLLTVGLTSFAFLFALCCITCTGVRHYKQDQLKTRIASNNMNNMNTYDHTMVQLHGKGQSYP